jgi:hypothetical protein
MFESNAFLFVSLTGNYTIEDVDHIETEKQMFEWIQTTVDRISKQIIEYTQLHHGGLVLYQKGYSSICENEIETIWYRYSRSTIYTLFSLFDR